MKRFISILCLVVFLIQGASTFCILGSFYINRNYISSTICINRFDAIPVCKGQCYLSKTLNDNEKQQQKFPDLKQKEIQLFFQEEELQNLGFEHPEEVVLPSVIVLSCTTKFYPCIFHPPQAA